MGWPEPANYDYTYWPRPEVVTIVQRGLGGSTLTASVAMRDTPQTRTEQSPMGARYLSTELTWYLAGPEIVPQGVEILPGDKISADVKYGQDGSAKAEWTIQEPSYNPLDDVWTCRSKRLFIHPRQRSYITVQRPRRDPLTGLLPQSPTGREIRSWEDVYTDEVCAVYKRSQEDSIVDDQEGTLETYLIILERDLTLTSNDRILLRWNEFGSGSGTGTSVDEDERKILDISSYESEDLIDELPHLTCVRKP